ncbi:MAG TPA: DUF1003 domain-containing protein [Gemmatimonadales bacterium]|nr:DUF1003 domain-containing protein [Gemmatimonadales bacterium]
MPRKPTSHRKRRASSAPRSAEELVRRNVERVMALETAEQRKATRAERVADAITAFSGSVRFVWISVLLVGGWVAANLLLPKRDRLDPFPFPLLTLVLSVEAILLSIFILMSQNRAAKISEKRGHLDLQLNILAEQENTKMLLMLEKIADAVGAEWDDGPEVRVLEEATRPESLSAQIDKAVSAGDKSSSST